MKARAITKNHFISRKARQTLDQLMNIYFSTSVVGKPIKQFLVSRTFAITNELFPGGIILTYFEAKTRAPGEIHFPYSY